MKFFIAEGARYPMRPVSNEEMDVIYADPCNLKFRTYPYYYSPDGRLWPAPEKELMIEDIEDNT